MYSVGYVIAVIVSLVDVCTAGLLTAVIVSLVAVCTAGLSDSCNC